MSWYIIDLVHNIVHKKVMLQSPEPRPPSPMQFNPEDVNAKCDICGASMSYFGITDPLCGGNDMMLSFSCKASWLAPSRDDLYWTEYTQCGKVSKLYRNTSDYSRS